MCGCGQNLTNKRNRFFFFFKERQRERDRDRETGRKARHQQGFSFVKQEVWGTKGQTAWLFQSVPMLSHCFHCHNSRRALYPALLCLSQQNASKKSICCVCIHVGVCTAVKTKKKMRLGVGAELIKFMQQNVFRSQQNCQVFENPYKINNLLF